MSDHQLPLPAENQLDVFFFREVSVLVIAYLCLLSLPMKYFRGKYVNILTANAILLRLLCRLHVDLSVNQEESKEIFLNVAFFINADRRTKIKFLR